MCINLDFGITKKGAVLVEYRELTSILVKTEKEKLKKIAEKIENKYKVKILKPGDNALTMMGVRESVDSLPFYIGEVLISRCIVSVEDRKGYGFIMSDNIETAYHLALIDAVIYFDDQLREEIYKTAEKEKKRIELEKKKEYAVLEKTKVKFKSMEEF
ncbi:MAG: PhnG protein [Candidatus Frackibacter sp. T328-2]|jgi:alpha-D-ribose 1-methylphosphonate 5-triphosphate synthase subunit PhnG|uniref:Alpha-D-ribose 1-methylphosphonate 5-triphosphate synthase subunit PhnG n=1 Tax=Halanaerobium congolense TaxID=54121 RepID=A0A318E8E2_9FIRM|nr:MAG: PhnG protein [Candidatus Frackibacter sp. T328-2]PXV65560.1 alpha-D-ribose 1-methylphosphonate 5-triphosphate synthase subunit PhnG [Halanaerobium congolense]